MDLVYTEAGAPTPHDDEVDDASSIGQPDGSDVSSRSTSSSSTSGSDSDSGSTLRSGRKRLFCFTANDVNIVRARRWIFCVKWAF